ncbi:MAG: hypothetical protein DMF59_14155 [Acidobacteria bacterium]|nr:MAG: hypothetical protein DMF59_14155 [Acidobacteriota bacterium]
MEPRRWLIAGVIVFAALWGWRELAVRAQRERIASHNAEISRLTVENERLADQNKKLNFELNVLAMAGTKAFNATSAQGSVRIFVNPLGQGVAIVEKLPSNAYELSVLRTDQLKMQSVATFDVPPAGAKTVSLEHLPAISLIKSFSLTTR